MKLGLIHRLEDLSILHEEQRLELSAAANQHPFRVTRHYAALIDWTDPSDPLRRIILPSAEEDFDWGEDDPSEEQRYTVAYGLQHKYPTTALMLVSDQCAGLCRFCFRKRVFHTDNVEVLRNFAPALAYIREHKEITNVLLTGGDPLLLPTGQLERLLKALREIPHVGVIRIGSKMLAFHPRRFLEDHKLLAMLGHHSQPERRLYIMAHFNHPREVSPETLTAVDLLLKSGVILTNQTPLLRGVNDHPDVLVELFRKLAFAGVPPYYVFQCRPTRGNRAFVVPIEAGYQLVEEAKARLSGIAKRARFVISHSTGKVEVVGMTEGEIVFRYWRAAEDANRGRTVIFRRNPKALWFDDYDHAVETFHPLRERGYYGPD